jgi:uncharacterized membrane protein
MKNPSKNGIALTAAKIFFLLASIGAAYLLVAAIKNGPIAGCGSGSGCDTVMKRRWAYLLPGVPVTVPALLTYLTLLYGMFFKSKSEVWQGILLVGSLMVIGAAIWFIGLQVVVIKALCKFCMATHLFGIAGSVCLLRSSRSVPRELKPFAAAAAAMALAMMAAFQIFLPQKTTANTRIGSGGKIVNIGKLEIDIGHLPHRGNPESDKQLLVLFDYTCASCRRVHDYLSRAEERFGADNYLLVMVPVPLNPDCNRHFEKVMPEHRDACLFASMAFALWSIDREKFYEYDRWMIEAGSPRFPPKAADARAKAEGLVGKELLAETLANPGIKARIDHATKLWSFFEKQSNRSTMPKMLWSSGIMTEGAAESEFGLFSQMEEQLGLKRQD